MGARGQRAQTIGGEGQERGTDRYVNRVYLSIQGLAARINRRLMAVTG